MKKYNSLKPHNIRHENIKRILRLIRKSDKLYSRADLAKELSLSAPSVSSIIKILIDKKILFEYKTGDSTQKGGRKPILLKINKHCGFILGIVINKNRIDIALSNLKGEIEEVINANYNQKNFSKPEDCVKLLKRLIDELLQKVNAEGKLLGIGIVVPGVFDVNEETIKFAPNIRLWSKVPIKKELQEEYNCKIIIENSTNAAALGERWKGKINKRDNAIFIKIGKGIGSGIILNGKLYKGFQNLAGEIGFMVTNEKQIPEQKSDVGTLEKLYGVEGVVNKTNEKLSKKLNFDLIAKRAKKGDKEIIGVLEEISTNLAIVLANIICVLNPEVVVLGGSYTEIAPVFIDKIRNIVDKIVPVMPEIVISNLGKKGFYIGAIAQLMENLEEEIVRKYKL